MRVIEALAARCAPGRTPGPKSSLRKARITPPCETTTIREPSGWRARDGRDGLPEPGDDLLVGLRADERPAFLLRDGEELFRQLGISLFLLGPGVAFEDAPVLSLRPSTGTTSPAKPVARG